MEENTSVMQISLHLVESTIPTTSSTPQILLYSPHNMPWVFSTPKWDWSVNQFNKTCIKI